MHGTCAVHIVFIPYWVNCGEIIPIPALCNHEEECNGGPSVKIEVIQNLCDTKDTVNNYY